MPAHMYPPELKGEVQKGEKKVFESLKKNLTNDYHVIYSRHKIKIENGFMRENEGDFIIYNRKKGIIVLEVKDSCFSYDNERGCWVLDNKFDEYGRKKIMPHQGPWVQAEIEKSELYKTIKYNPATSYICKNNKCKILFGVWLLQASTKTNISSWPGDSAPEITLFAEDLINPLSKIENIFNIRITTPVYKDRNTGEIKDGKEIINILDDNDEKNLFDNIFFPKANIISKNSYDSVLNELNTIQLLKEQTIVLDFTDQNQTVAINGAAGTGKTLVAVEKAKRLAKEGDRILFLCFNNPLKEYLEKKHSYKNVFYKTIDKFISDDLCDGHGVDYDKGLSRLLELCNNENESLPYKHVIIDEGQDFAVQQLDNQDILQFLYEVIKSKDDDSCFYIFYDELQKVNGANGKDNPEYIKKAQTKVTLLTNCRNTKNIAMASLKPILVTQAHEIGKQIEDEVNNNPDLNPTQKMEKIQRKKAILNRNIERRQNNIKGSSDGDKPEMIFISNENLKEVINKVIKDYLGKSQENKISDIAILTCMSKETTIFSEEINAKEWNYHGSKIPFMTTSTFKGLEANFIILIEISKKTFTHYAMSYYVGTSRAKQNLSVIANLSEEDCKYLITDWLETKIRGKETLQSIFAGCMKCKYREI